MYTDLGGDVTRNHWYSWFYDMRTTRVVWARSVALPDRLLVQARAGKLVDLRESCLWQRGERSVRMAGWWAGPGWRADLGWPPAALSIYLLDLPKYLLSV